MTNTEFKERLEEIFSELQMWAGTNSIGNGEIDEDGIEEATQQLTQLFQDFKDTVIGDMEYRETEDMSLQSWTIEDYKEFAKNNLRAEQHQTANLILKGE